MKIIILFLIILNISLNAQSVEFAGKVVDHLTREPIAYANIGVVGKNVGTVSDSKGNFKFSVDPKYARDTMRISIIGYKPIDVAVYKFQEQLNQFHEVTLMQQNLEIPEIIVVDKTLQRKILGNRNGTKNVSIGFSTDTLGNEMAIRCKVKRKKSYLRDLKIHIAHNPYDTLRFRVNIYDSKKGKPNEIINKQAIYTTTVIEDGIHVVDLSPYNIVTDQDFFVSFEWIEDLTHLVSESHSGLNFVARLFGKPVYHRTTSHGSWKKLAGLGITMNVEVLQ